MLRRSDQSVAALTACTLAPVVLDDWQTVFARHPRVATAVHSAVAHEEAQTVEHLVSLGRRTVRQRTGHPLCELGMRLGMQGLLDGEGFTCPIPQAVLADALGLSVVHLNRTLRRFREAGLVRMAAGGRARPLPRRADGGRAVRRRLPAPLTPSPRPGSARNGPPCSPIPATPSPGPGRAPGMSRK